MEKIKCPWCGLETIKASMPKHIRISHQKTTLEFWLATNDLTDQDIPACPICGEHCGATVMGFNPTCNKPKCLKAWHHQNKSRSL